MLHSLQINKQVQGIAAAKKDRYTGVKLQHEQGNLGWSASPQLPALTHSFGTAPEGGPEHLTQVSGQSPSH
eukprot:scaffold11975_cov18-Tisochrysis_lutea.AAC.1